jgi:adenylate cyclase
MTPPSIPPRIPAPGPNDEFWHDYLTRGSGRERRMRSIYRRLPHSPRCRLCAVPFGGPIGSVARAFGKSPSPKHPQMCRTCYTFIEKHHGGAEIEVSLVFADIRDSTTLAEGMSASEFRTLLDRFYRAAAEVIYRNDGGVDKFVGDEIVAMFFPLMSGERHAARAVDAAMDLLRATGHGSPEGPWVPIGVGVHSGPAWVGAVGDEMHTEITALGDSVNVTARLASVARGGEVLVTVEAAGAAGIELGGLARRSLELKGREQPTEVVSLSVP